jgi:cobalt-zinc-cadmium efflux system membrane fusion protein
MIARVFALALAASLSCATTERPPQNWHVDGDAVTLDHPSPARFETQEVQLGPPLPSPAVTARVTTLELSTSPSFPPLPGRVVEIRVHLGDHVEQEQELVRVQTGDLSVLQAQVAAARLSVETKLATVAKLERMVEARLAPEHELTLARAELAEARLAAKTAKARLRSLSVEQAGESSFWVLANRSGTVVQLGAALGQQVRPDQELPVATVADLDEVLVVADVSQRDATRLRAGTGAQISIPGSTHAALAGVVELVSEVVDPDRQTVPVRIRVPNGEHWLRPNAFVDVGFVAAEQTPVIRIPATAVVRDGAETVVFVEQDQGHYQAREVELGRRTTTEAEVVHGLVAGERIVTSNALLLLNAIDLQRQ